MLKIVDNFYEKSKEITKNPLGIIALFISFIYSLSCLVLGISLDALITKWERLPFVWFIIGFPIIVLGVFTYLVIFHHKKLYAPGDYKDETNFLFSGATNKEMTEDLTNLADKIRAAGNNISPDSIVTEIEKIKEKVEKIRIPINNLWILNHWGSDCAKIVGDKMIFLGNSAPRDVDGSHVDLKNILEIGKTYEVSCFVKAQPNTDGKFMLWCHDNTGSRPNGISAKTSFETPSTDGDIVKLNFKPNYNCNIRIHLQYTPGRGQIEIGDVKIYELNK